MLADLRKDAGPQLPVDRLKRGLDDDLVELKFSHVACHSHASTRILEQPNVIHVKGRYHVADQSLALSTDKGLVQDQINPL